MFPTVACRVIGHIRASIEMYTGIAAAFLDLYGVHDHFGA
jgi:hypothetical protein